MFHRNMKPLALGVPRRLLTPLPKYVVRIACAAVVRVGSPQICNVGELLERQKFRQILNLKTLWGHVLVLVTVNRVTQDF